MHEGGLGKKRTLKRLHACVCLLQIVHVEDTLSCRQHQRINSGVLLMNTLGGCEEEAAVAVAQRAAQFEQQQKTLTSADDSAAGHHHH